MAGRAAAIGRGAASALLTGLLLVLPPLLLAPASGFLGGARRLLRAGGPQRAWHALLRPPDAAAWHAVLVSALWLAWLWLVLCVLAELLTGAGALAGRRVRSEGRRGTGRAFASLLVGPLLVVLLANARQAAPAGAGAVAAGLPAADVEPARHPPWSHRVGPPAPAPAAPPADAGAADHRGRGEIRPDRPPAAALADAGAADHRGRGEIRPDRPPAAPGGTTPPTTAGGGRWPIAALLAGAGGALVAVVVEEARRAGDARELRRLRRAAAAAATEPTEPVTAPAAPARGYEPPPASPPPPRPAPSSPPPPAPAAGEVRVRLLGEPLVEGAPGPFDRPKVIESLAYLALHPDGVSKQRWATALWPDRSLSPNSLNTAVWQLRRALGVDAGGERHLPAARSGRLRLGPGVRTDLAELEALAHEGSTGSLRAALELVRGRPFDGLGDADWIVLEGHASRAEAAVAAAALALGDALLAERDWAGAAWAARRALEACPYDERLYHLLADAASSAGNRVGAAAALAELRRAVGTDSRAAGAAR